MPGMQHNGIAGCIGVKLYCSCGSYGCSTVWQDATGGEVFI